MSYGKLSIWAVCSWVVFELLSLEQASDSLKFYLNLYRLQVPYTKRNCEVLHSTEFFSHCSLAPFYGIVPSRLTLCLPLKSQVILGVIPSTSP